MSLVHKGTKIASKAVTGDTLPVGTVVEYEGSVVPPGYEQVVASSGKNYKEYVLFDEAQGYEDTITLSETSSNFAYLEIFYKDTSTTAGYNSCKVYNPNGKKANLLLMEVDATNEIWLKMKVVVISGNTLTPSLLGQGTFNASSQRVYNTSNVIYITRVVGYKEM